MAVTEKLKSLVDQMPEPDRRGMFSENIDKAKIEKAVAEIAKGGAANLLGLIEMLGEPGAKENVKPHYALHCVVNHALISGDEAMRKQFCETIASQLLNKSLHPYNRAYLCQELQWAGREESCPALGNVLLDKDVTDAAATALAAIGGESAASQLRDAVKLARGKARRNLLDALAALAEPESSATFQHALNDGDREVRIAAALGLAKVGGPAAVEILVQASDAAEGWERTQMTKACLVLAEHLAAAGEEPAAKQVYEQLKTTRTGKSEKHVREAAQRGLAAIA